MKIFATIVGILLVDVAIIYLLAQGSEDSLVPATVGTTALSGAALGWLLIRIAPRWSSRRLIIVAGTALPVLVWIIAFGFDVLGYVEHLREPDEPFMIGISIMLFLPCGVCALLGLGAAALVRSVMKRSDAA